MSSEANVLIRLVLTVHFRMPFNLTVHWHGLFIIFSLAAKPHESYRSVGYRALLGLMAFQASARNQSSRVRAMSIDSRHVHQGNIGISASFTSVYIYCVFNRYHSHLRDTILDGQYGAFVYQVREPPSRPTDD